MAKQMVDTLEHGLTEENRFNTFFYLTRVVMMGYIVGVSCIGAAPCLPTHAAEVLWINNFLRVRVLDLEGFPADRLQPQIQSVEKRGVILLQVSKGPLMASS